MTTEEENVAMMLQLEEKITRRIREQIYMVLYGMESEPGTIADSALGAYDLRNLLRQAIINDPYSVAELTKKIGAKMANVQY